MSFLGMAGVGLVPAAGLLLLWYARRLAARHRSLMRPEGTTAGPSRIIDGAIAGRQQQRSEHDTADARRDPACLPTVADEYPMQNLDPATECRAIIHGMQDHADRKAVTCRLNVARNIGTVRADWFGFRQILFNLLSHALTHVPVGGSVDLHVERSSGRTTFHVSHSGIDVPDYMQSNLQEPLAHVHGRNASLAARHANGFHLGLSVVRELVAAYGGDLSIGSGKGKISVTVCLPDGGHPTKLDDARAAGASALRAGRQ